MCPPHPHIHSDARRSSRYLINIIPENPRRAPTHSDWRVSPQQPMLTAFPAACVCVCSVVSHSLRPHGLYPTVLLCPWDFPGKNTGVGCHALLQGIFPTQGANPHFLCLLLWQVHALPLCHRIWHFLATYLCRSCPSSEVVCPTFTPVFIAALFTIARTWKYPRCPSTDEWVRKLWYIHTMEYCPAIKRNTFESVLLRWMNLEPIIQSEVSQKKKDKYHILMHIYIYMYIYGI